MPGPSLITDITPMFHMDAKTEDLEKARLIIYMLQTMGYDSVFSASEYEAFTSSMIPAAYERSRLHHLSASGVSAVIARLLKKLVKGGIKYGAPIIKTIRDVRSGEYEPSRPLLPGIGPKIQDFLNDKSQGMHYAMSSRFARALIPGVSTLQMSVEPPRYVRALAEARKGVSYTSTRKFIALRDAEGTYIPDLLELTVTNDPNSMKGSYHEYNVRRSNGQTKLRLYGFTQLPTETLHMDLKENVEGSADLSNLAMVIRLADQLSALPDDEIICFATNSKLGIVGVSYSFAFEAMIFGYPEEYIYSGDSSPLYGWLPAMGATQE